MKVVITGGGTGGHTSAGLAVAAALRQRGVECAWIGSRAGIEARRVPEAGLAYHAIATGKLRRYWDWQNVPDLLVRVPVGIVQSCRLLRHFRPDVIFATGGFVALPPVIAGRGLGIPIMVHEQTAVVGLANRIAGRLARRVALTFAETRHPFPRSKVVETGNPLRPGLQGGSRETGLASPAFDPARPLVYVTGGAQGSHRINRALGVILPQLTRVARLVHQCGDHPTTGDRKWLEEQAVRLPPDQRARYRLVPYVGDDLAEIYAAASLVVGRAGAGTVNECCHLGLPALLIPLSGSSGGEQMANARIVERAGGAVVLPETELTPERLLTTIQELLGDPLRRKAMGERARTLARPDAAPRLVAELLALVGHAASAEKS